MPYFEPLTTSHRVNMHGRLVRCPHCSHVSRVYHLGFSALKCINCQTMVRKYDWTVGPNVTRKDLQPTYRWKAERDRSRTFGKTKKILMSRLSHPVSEYKITKEELPGWSRPDLVLVIDRRFDRAVQVFSDTHLPDDQSLEWADSSGSRSVHLFMLNGEQVDLPHRTFQLFKDFLAERHTGVDLLMHREDPGLGIFLPELDEAILQAGATLDGCIKAKA
tara:strand:- start:77 stop:733 length:657 start_codon:yes stop_codon:yes gene_type:complete